MIPPPPFQIEDLVGPDRDQALPILIDSFEGIYRWHAKRTLYRVSTVRGARLRGELVGVSMLEDLVPGVGYVYYVAVGLAHRRRGIGTTLLGNALEWFRSRGVEVVYAAAQEENAPSLALFGGQGFRAVDRDEPGFREGGLGAWGLRSKMMVVSGEVLLGLRIVPRAAPFPPVP